MGYYDSLEYPDVILDNIFSFTYVSSLFLLGGLLATQFSLIGYNLYKMMKTKKIKIIRGVPGTGKHSYVYYLEDKLDRNFVICDWNKYFMKDNKYNFNGKEMDKAEAYSFETFINSVLLNVERIYIIGHFPKKWMYEKYIKVAKMNNYEVDITELDCNNIQELNHYNSRSIHEIPHHKSHRIYTEWEEDDRVYKRCPYLDDNVELKKKREECLIDSDDEEAPKNVIHFLPNIVLIQ